MALHLYSDNGVTQVSESPQTQLTAPTNANSPGLSVQLGTGFLPGDKVRIGNVQKTVESANSNTITLTNVVGYVFPAGTLVTKSDMSAPDSITASGYTGGTVDKKLYIGNDDYNKRYSNVVITTVNDDANVNVQYAADSNGTPGTFGESLTVGDIPVRTAGIPTVAIWRRIIIAAGQSSQEKVDVKHKITGTEYTVYTG